MNEVARIKYALDDQAFFPLFHTPEIKARRAERMRQAQQQNYQQARREAYNQGYSRGYSKGEARARKEGERRVRAVAEAKDQESAGLVADVAGGFTLAATLVAIAMMI